MRYHFTILFSILFFSIQAQFEYEASEKNPYGLPNPKASEQVKDFAPMIGTCDCKSTSRNPDQTWAEPINMTWTFKYIMNGMAVQDLTLKEDGNHSGSIRQYHQDSARWYVHYFSSAKINSSPLSMWEGNLENDKIVLYRKQKAPNGMDGFYRLTFYEMKEDGYKWIGEWIDTAGTIVYPTWKIDCTKSNGKD